MRPPRSGAPSDGLLTSSIFCVTIGLFGGVDLTFSFGISDERVSGIHRLSSGRAAL